MEHQRQSFSDVVLELARKYQLPIETLDGPQQERLRKQLSRREQLHKVLTLAAGWFRSQLRSPAGAPALAYLRQGRGLSESTLEAVELAGADVGVVGEPFSEAELQIQAPTDVDDALADVVALAG